MNCKNCGNLLQVNNKFCSECGAIVVNKEKEAVQCNECGKYFKKEFCVCPFCGTELIEECIKNYENEQKKGTVDLSSKYSNFFTRNKKGLKIAGIVAIVLYVLIMIIYANSGYTCSQCGERFYEGKSVFGEYLCNDCFYN